MKFRSPSPVAGGALPTPPHSPTETAMVPKAHVAVSMLDHLRTFYQQEQYWVHHTRASLEMAIAKGIDGDALLYPPTSDDQSMPSPASSTSTLCDSPPHKTVMESAARASRWAHRKNKMRLRLDGINSHPHRDSGLKSKKSRPLKAPPTEPGARLLEMFSELVDARMESCQRITRMVQESASRQQQLLMC
ncbi:hypothetical protein BC629DRAFT_1584669 [Irpex lacteus]|nr:hypothetical protein BC629DRAFT_1584669 [Irpex lacteus]